MDKQFTLQLVDCGGVNITKDCIKDTDCVKCCIPKCKNNCLKKNGGSLNLADDCEMNCEDMCHRGGGVSDEGSGDSVFDFCKQNPNFVENQCNPSDFRKCCINKCVLEEKGAQQTQNCQNTCNNKGKQYCGGGAFINHECNFDDDKNCPW